MATKQVRTSAALLLCMIIVLVLCAVVVGFMMAPRSPWAFYHLAPGSTVTTFTNMDDCRASAQLHHFDESKHKWNPHKKHQWKHMVDLDFCSDLRTRVQITSDARVIIDMPPEDK